MNVSQTYDDLLKEAQQIREEHPAATTVWMGRDDIPLKDLEMFAESRGKTLDYVSEPIGRMRLHCMVDTAITIWLYSEPVTQTITYT